MVVSALLRFTDSHGVNVKGNVDMPHPPTRYLTFGFFNSATLPTLTPLSHIGISQTSICVPRMVLRQLYWTDAYMARIMIHTRSIPNLCVEVFAPVKNSTNHVSYTNNQYGTQPQV